MKKGFMAAFEPVVKRVQIAVVQAPDIDEIVVPTVGHEAFEVLP